MCRRIYGRVVATLGAALALLYVANAPNALAQGPNLVVNPLFARELPVPGWIANHREEWVRQHAVYRTTCASAEVVSEIRFLNRLIACDQYMLSLVDTPDPANPASSRMAVDARATAPNLRRDIDVADGLIAQLNRLPACGARSATASVTANTPSPAAEPLPNENTAEPLAPEPAAAHAASPPVPGSTTPEAAAPVPAAPPPTASGGPPSETAERLVIRFDHRLAALTPSGVRAFNEAVAAAHSGKNIQLAIEGCDAGADFSDGSLCARWLYSLKNRLEDAGVKNPKRLFTDLP